MKKSKFKEDFMMFLRKNRIEKQFIDAITNTDDDYRTVKYKTIESYLEFIPVVKYMSAWCIFNYQNNGSKLYLLEKRWQNHVMQEVKNAHKYIFYSKEKTNEGLSGKYVCTLNYEK